VEKSGKISLALLSATFAAVGAQAQINGLNSSDGASSSATQAIARVGIHTRF
jgi:hypothetical protein